MDEPGEKERITYSTDRRIVAPAWRHKIRRLFGRNMSYRQACDKSWVIHPEVTSTVPRAIYLDAQLQRVEGFQPSSSKNAEWARITGGVRLHAATRAFRLPHAVLHDGYVYGAGARLALESHAESYRLLATGAVIRNAALASTLFGNRYFGHFITDDLTLNIEASTLGEAVCTEQMQTPHQLQYRDLFKVHATALKSACFDSLIVLDDFGQNDGKRARYEQLRKKLWALNMQPSCPGVMLLRGRTGVARLLENEAQIAAHLGRLGFKALWPERMTASEIATAVSNVKIVVGVEGSQLAHGILSMHPQGTLVVLQPPHLFNNVFKDYTDCLGMSYAFVVGRHTLAGFEVSTDDLSRVLDLIR